jgi:hypothetical protein
MERWRTRGPAALLTAIAWTGTVTVQPEDVDAARHRLDSVVERLGGVTGRERAVLDPAGGLRRTTVVVRVPAAEFDAALQALGDLGILTDQTRTAEDLTADVVDLQAVLAAQRAASARVEALLPRVRTRADLASVRAELRTRQAEVAVHERELSALRRQVARSTIRLRLVSEPTAPTTAPPLPDPVAEDLWWRLGLAVLLGLAR